MEEKAAAKKYARIEYKLSRKRAEREQGTSRKRANARITRAESEDQMSTKREGYEQNA
jgi:hypothetical protein